MPKARVTVKLCVCSLPNYPFWAWTILHVRHGQLRTDLERREAVIGAYDMLIAAHALTLNATLVTNNEREFKRVKGLKIENWVS